MMVYIHKRKSDGEVFYVGCCTNKYRSSTSYGRNKNWVDYVKKNGEWEREIVYSGLSKLEAYKMEAKLIMKYKLSKRGGTLTNIVSGNLYSIFKQQILLGERRHP